MADQGSRNPGRVEPLAAPEARLERRRSSALQADHLQSSAPRLGSDDRSTCSLPDDAPADASSPTPSRSVSTPTSASPTTPNLRKQWQRTHSEKRPSFRIREKNTPLVRSQRHGTFASVGEPARVERHTNAERIAPPRIRRVKRHGQRLERLREYLGVDGDVESEVK